MTPVPTAYGTNTGPTATPTDTAHAEPYGHQCANCDAGPDRDTNRHGNTGPDRNANRYGHQCANRDTRPDRDITDTATPVPTATPTNGHQCANCDTRPDRDITATATPIPTATSIPTTLPKPAATRTPTSVPTNPARLATSVNVDAEAGTVVITGVGTPGATVGLRVDGQMVATTTVDVTGAWQLVEPLLDANSAALGIGQVEVAGQVSPLLLPRLRLPTPGASWLR